MKLADCYDSDAPYLLQDCVYHIYMEYAVSGGRLLIKSAGSGGDSLLVSETALEFGMLKLETI
jgi:hypothetical protein